MTSQSLTFSCAGYRYRKWSATDSQHRTVRVHAWPPRRRGDKDAHPRPQRHPHGPRPGSGHFSGITGVRGNEDHRGEKCMCSEKKSVFSYNVANEPVIQMNIIQELSIRMPDNFFSLKKIEKVTIFSKKF